MPRKRKAQDTQMQKIGEAERIRLQSSLRAAAYGVMAPCANEILDRGERLAQRIEEAAPKQVTPPSAQRRRGKKRQKPIITTVPAHGQYIEELIDASSGHAKRQRRIDEHPLTLAFERGKLNCVGRHNADDRKTAGDRFRALYYQMSRTGRDSTDMGVGGGGSPEPWTQLQVNAIRKIAEWRAALSTRDFMIIQQFCGEGHTMVHAVRCAQIPCHEDGIAARVCEALDGLVDVVASAKGKRIAA